MRIMTFLILLLFASSSQAELTSQQYYELSISVDDADFREYLRTNLAEVDQSSSYGLFANAWVADKNGDEDKARALYRKALDLNPDLYAAANNLAQFESGDNPEIELKLREQAARSAIESNATDAEYYVRAMIESVFNEEDQIERRARLVDGNKYEKMAYYYLESKDAQSDGDTQRALELISKAADIGLSSDIIEREMSLKLNRASELGYDLKQKYRVIGDYQSKHMDRYFSYPANIQEFLLRTIVDKTHDLYPYAYAHLASIWKEAYKIRKAPVTAISYASTLAAQGKVRASIEILNEALVAYPNNPSIHDHKSWIYSHNAWNATRAIGEAKKAVDSSKLTATKNLNIYHLAQSYRDFAREQAGIEYLLPKLTQKVEANGAYLYAGLLQLLISTQQFEKAKKYLDKAEAIGYELQDVYPNMINLGVAANRTKAAYYKKNPFLNDWNKKFNGRLSLAIEFASNSDVIPKNAHSSLDKAAFALLASGAENYIFSIEGHTDSSGGAVINNPLSQRRAASVKRYFSEQHRIPTSKLQVTGYGAEQPIATNTSNKGKQLNRRVDIRPYGNVNAPEVAVAAEMNTVGATFSADGQFMATGMFPITLWDIKKKLKLRELHIGGRVRAFSPNGRYLAALSNSTDSRGVSSNALYISDVKTGILEGIISSIGGNTDIAEFTWSPFSNQLAYITSRGALEVYDLALKKAVSATRVGRQIGGKLLWLDDGQRIVVGQYQAEELKIYDAQDLTLLQSVEGVDWPHAMSISSDERKVIVANNDRTISLFNSNNFALIDRVKNRARTPRDIVAIPGKTQFLFNDKFSDSVVAIFDYQRMDFIAGKKFEKEPFIGASPDGKKIYVASGETLTIRDPQSFAKLDEIVSTNHTGEQLLWDKSNDILLSEDSGGTTLWNIEEGRRVHSIPKANKTYWDSIEQDGSQFVSVAESGELLLFDSNTFVLKRLVGVDFEVVDSYKQKHHLVVTGREAGTKDKPTGTAYIALFDLETFKHIRTIDVEVVNQPVRHDVRNEGIVDISIDDRTNTLAVATWWNDGDTGNVYSKIVQLFDINDGTKKENVYVKRAVHGLSFKGMEQGFIKVYGTTSTMTFDLVKKKGSNWQNKEFNTRPMDNGEPLLWASFRLMRGEKTVLSKEYIKSVVTDEKRNLLLVLTTSNKIIYYSLKDLEPRLTINNRKDEQWVAYTPDGYFSSSINGTKEVYWSFGDRFLPFDALKDRYERPQVITKALKTLFSGVDVKPSKPVIEPDVLDIPFIVSRVGKAEISTDQESVIVKLKIEKLDKTKPDPDFFFTINDRKTRGFVEDPFYDDNKEALYITRKIPLGVGENRVEANLVYRGVTANTQRWLITRNETEQPEGTKLPNLWYFGVGVSEYQNSLQNLDFAHRDAIELGKTLKNSQGKLFNQVHTKVLVNDKATARDVQIEMNEFLRQAAPEDQLVLFIAGHGIQDSSQKLFFMPHDGDLKKPYTGIPVSSFKDVLDNRPINQRALFLLDICHAGSTGSGNKGRITSEDVIKKLSEGTSTTVLASSSGAQQSFEDESFGGGHGAFTFSIIEALKGQGDSEVGDLDGYTSLLEVIMYTMREVPRMTNRAQKPVLPVLENFDDYRLSKSGSI